VCVCVCADAATAIADVDSAASAAPASAANTTLDAVADAISAVGDLMLSILRVRACVCELKLRGTSSPPMHGNLAVAVVSPLPSLSHAVPRFLSDSPSKIRRRNRRWFTPDLDLSGISSCREIAAPRLQRPHESVVNKVDSI